jgi:hypothetical protein
LISIVGGSGLRQITGNHSESVSGACPVFVFLPFLFRR